MANLTLQATVVSIHAPVWGATIWCSTVFFANTFQSTHPCGVRQALAPDIKNLVVSIHAPVWGATVFSPFGACKPGFQSTHPCGVRRSDNHALRWIVGFNPRTRVGCDQPLENLSIYYQVSIHAPVWGATVLASRIF